MIFKFMNFFARLSDAPTGRVDFITTSKSLISIISLRKHSIELKLKALFFSSKFVGRQMITLDGISSNSFISLYALISVFHF